MKYHVKERPLIERHMVEAEQRDDGSWRLIDCEGAESFSNNEDFLRFYEAVP